MKRKAKITGFLVVMVSICVLVFLASRIFANKETLGDTGWTLDQFIEWAEQVQPVVAHKRWEIREGGYDYEIQPAIRRKVCKDGFLAPIIPFSGLGMQKVWKEGGKELMDPNEPFLCGIVNDANDVPFLASLMYKYEWDFRLPAPYEKLPEPVRKVIDSVNQADVGKNIGGLLPYAAEPVAICALKEGKVITSEAVEVRLLSLSDDKLEFAVETEPFILSDNPDVKGRIGNVTVLYVDPYKPPPSEVNICKPEKQRKGK